MTEATKDHSTLVQTILTGTRWATIFRLLGQIVSWLCTLVVVRYISPSDYGLNAMLESPLVVLTLLSTLGLDSALVQNKNMDAEHLRSVFGWLLLVNVTLFLVLFFGSPILAFYYHEPRLAMLAKVVAVIYLFVPFRVIPNALMDRNLDFRLKAQVEVIATISTAVLTLVMAYFGAGVWALVLGMLTNRLLSAIALMLMKPWFIWPKFKIKETLHFFSFGGLVTLSGLFLLLSDMVITVIAGPRLGAVTLGFFSVGAQFAQLPLSKGTPIINQTMLPAFSKFQGDPKAATYYLDRLLGVAALLFVPLLVGLACVSKPFVLVVLGEKWLGCVLPIQIMSLAMIFRLCISLYKSVITSMGRGETILFLGVAQFVTLLIITLIMRNFGLIGLIFGWAGTECLVTMTAVQMSKKVLHTSYAGLFRTLRPALLSAVAMAVCVLGLSRILKTNSNLTSLVLQVILGGVVYYLVLYRFFSDQLNIALRAILGNRIRT